MNELVLSSSAEQVIAGIALAAIAGFISFRLKFLSLSGAITAAFIGMMIFGGGGLPWAVPLLVFFLSSSTLSKLALSPEISTAFEKSSMRDGWQVAANGGVGALVVTLWLCLGDGRLYVAYLGSLAAVTADTWATEIGTRMNGPTVSVGSLRMVRPGTSGGVSATGTVAGILGAVVVALSGMWWTPQGAPVIAVVVVSGFAGLIIDSLLGATVQAQYRCSRCQKVVEAHNHCSMPAILHSGLRWLTNDWVNVACSLAGTLAAWLLVGCI